MAKLAPSARRGEASGYFMAMPAIATLVAPAVGVAVFLSAGEVPALALTFVLGVIATAIAFVVRIPSKPASAAADDSPKGRGRILERSSFPSTIMVTTFMSTQSLFIVFPPVYLAQVGAPLGILTVYYPVYGLAKTVGQLLVGRVSDRLGRITPIITGCVIAIAGLGAFLLLEPVPALFASSMLYALGMAFAGPAIGALAIDRAPEGRVGAAMATYTLGYQLATGVSGILWGTIIAVAGYPWPFAAAAGMMTVTMAVGLRLPRTD
jgi:MFS family permease